MFILVDGIYPQFCRFVKGMKEPVTEAEKAFTEFQEAIRKDIERAFGVLQVKWKFTAHPMDLQNLSYISNRPAT